MCLNVGDKVMYHISFLIKNDLQYSKAAFEVFVVDGDGWVMDKDFRLKKSNGYYIYENESDLVIYQ